MKRQIVDFVRTLVGQKEVMARLDIIGAAQSSKCISLDKINTLPVEPIPVPFSAVQYYGDQNLWELPVQLCAKDCVGSEDIILDVGGNIGAVAVAFSKVVSDGHVYTFEPNPEMWSTLLATLDLNDVENVNLVPLACFSESGRIETFFSENSSYKVGSRLGQEIPGARRFNVTTVSLDDFCSKNNISPKFIKIDVEGAEIHVLRSATQVIDRCRPAIVFEYRPQSVADAIIDPMSFLMEKRYDFYDVNQCVRVTREYYLTLSHIPLVNVFAIPKESPLAKRWGGMGHKLVATWNAPVGERIREKSFKLDAGRHIISVKFDIPDDDIGGLAVKGNNRILAYYETRGRELKDHSNSNLIVELGSPQKISVELENKKNTDEAMLSGVDIRKIIFDGFSA